MKKLMFSILIISFSLCKAEQLSSRVADTTRIISGKVTGTQAYSPLEGVAIVAGSTKNMTGTMVDGAFTMYVSEKDSVLTVSLDGYETSGVKLTAENFYEIVLKPTSSKPNLSSIQRFFQNEFLIIVPR